MPRKPGPKVEPNLDPVRRRTLSLDDSTWRMLKVLGGGNVSRGVRRAARAEYDRYQRESSQPPK